MIIDQLLWCIVLQCLTRVDLFQFQISTLDWISIIDSNSLSDMDFYGKRYNYLGGTLNESYLEEFVNHRCSLHSIWNHWHWIVILPILTLTAIIVINAFPKKLLRIPLNRTFSSKLSFAILFMHFVHFINCACPKELTWTGELFGTGGKTAINSNVADCYLLLDCTFKKMSTTPVSITPNSKADLYSSGCTFTDCWKTGDGGCFYFNQNLKSSIIRACVTRCGADSHGGFIYYPDSASQQCDLKEISTFQKHPDSTGGNWFRHGTSRLCITNVNVTDYNPTKAHDDKATIIWNFNHYSAIGSVSWPPLWATYFMVVNCTGRSLFTFAAGYGGLYSWSYCSVVNCVENGGGIFRTWTTTTYFRNCYFQFVTKFLTEDGAGAMYLWNCQFAATSKQSGSRDFDNVVEYKNFPRLEIKDEGDCKRLSTIAVDVIQPETVVNKWCQNSVSNPAQGRIKHENVGDTWCCSITSSTFVDITISGENGGAVHFGSNGGNSVLYVEDSQFISCSVNYEGGAVYVNAGHCVIRYSCGSLCYANKGTFISVKKSDGSLDLIGCSLWNCSTESYGDYGYGAIYIYNGQLSFMESNFSQCKQNKGAAVVEYETDHTVEKSSVPGSYYVMCWKCSGQYGFYMRYRHNTHDFFIHIGNQATERGWYRIRSYMYLSFCYFHDYEDKGLLFYIESATNAYYLRLVGCYLSGTCPTVVTSALEYDTALVSENTVVTLSPGVVNSRNCHLLYLLTNTFSPSNQLSETIGFSKTKSFSLTLQLTYSISFSRTNSLTKSTEISASDSFTESIIFSLSIKLVDTSDLSGSDPQSISASFSASEVLIASQNVNRSDMLGFTDVISLSSFLSETNVLDCTYEHSATEDNSRTDIFDQTNQLSSSQDGFDETNQLSDSRKGFDKITLQFSETESFSFKNEPTSSVEAAVPGSDIVASTLHPHSTAIIGSGQTYPPTVPPIQTVAPASIKATRSNFPPSTIPKASTVPLPSTFIIESGQTYPPTHSLIQTVPPASTFVPVATEIPSFLPYSTIPPHSTAEPASTLLIDSGQTHPPTFLPMSTIPPASTLPPKTAYPASTFPPPSTDFVSSGQTFPETHSPKETQFPEATLSPFFVAATLINELSITASSFLFITNKDASLSHETKLQPKSSHEGKQEDDTGSTHMELLIVAIILMVILSVLFAILLMSEEKEKEKQNAKKKKQIAAGEVKHVPHPK